METTTNRRASVEALKPIAYRASQGISWSPEQRGEQWLNDCENSLQNHLAQIPEEMHATFEEKFLQLYAQWLAAMSRCISPMITEYTKVPHKACREAKQLRTRCAGTAQHVGRAFYQTLQPSATPYRLGRN